MPDLEPSLSSRQPPIDKKKKRKNKNHKSKSGNEAARRKQREETRSERVSVSDLDPALEQSLAGLHYCTDGPDPDLAKRTHFSSFPSSPLNTIFTPQSHFTAQSELEDEPSFSQALKECQKQRLRSEGAVISPRFIPLSMSKSSTGSSRSRSGTFPSPGTPNYTRYGWSSERVPQNRVLPFNHGKKLPSKWEDAEKWILSPVQLTGPGLPPHHRRPKSKSGPLGHTNGFTASPAVLQGENFSPFLAGVLIPEHGVCFNGSNNSSSNNNGGNNGILRSVSVSGWMDTLMEATAALPPSRQTKPEEKVQITREAVERITASILTKDVSTQMSSPEGSTESSPKEELSFSCSGPIEEVNNEEGSSRMEMRDVEIDKQVTVTRWSKKNVLRSFDKRSVDSSNKGGSANWEERERARCVNKSKKEEAKISAWENLQKAKAEAEIRRLEMKLEKKRASSMERILRRLSTAQKKADQMRGSVSADPDQCVRKSGRKWGNVGLLRGCFTCHVFN